MSTFEWWLVVSGGIALVMFLALVVWALMRAAALPTPPANPPTYRVTYCPRCRYSQLTPNTVHNCYWCDDRLVPQNEATVLHEHGRTA